MTAEQFVRAGIRLFGKDHWKALMAKAIGRDVSTVWRYAEDESRIPKVVELSVICLVAMSPQARGHLKRRLGPVKPGRPWKKRKLKPRVPTEKDHVHQRRPGGRPEK